MRFKWRNDRSRTACIVMAYARVCFKGLTVEKALTDTLATGNHCEHPDRISKRERLQLQKEVERKLKGGKRSA